MKILLCGLPGSGKTTYLAALWHLVQSREIPTVLEFDGLPAEREYLNKVAQRWRSCEAMERTDLGSEKPVLMKLKDGKERIELSIPDLSGEAWRALWEHRTCPTTVVDQARTSTGVLLCVHADDIKMPLPVVEATMQAEILGEEPTDAEEVPYRPKAAPTQSQLVDILQLLACPPLSEKVKRLAVVLSAWDSAIDEGKQPANYLKDHLPLLDQYLRRGNDYSEYEIFGVSAQGGELPSDAERLLAMRPSDRIIVIDKADRSSDLTHPLRWLLGMAD